MWACVLNHKWIRTYFIFMSISCIISEEVYTGIFFVRMYNSFICARVYPTGFLMKYVLHFTWEYIYSTILHFDEAPADFTWEGIYHRILSKPMDLYILHFDFPECVVHSANILLSYEKHYPWKKMTIKYFQLNHVQNCIHRWK